MSEHDEQPNSFEDDAPQRHEPERVPKFVSGRPGRMVSWKGLIERVVEEFRLEHGNNETEALRAAQTSAQRRGLVREAALYIFGVESVQLSPAEQAQIIGAAYSELFGYGALDKLFADEQVTTIALEGSDHVAVRYGAGAEFTTEEPIFDDIHHLRRILRRLLQHAGADLRQELPVIEVGLMVEERPVSVSVAMPPYSPELAADIRVHPRKPPTLAELAEADFLDESGRQLVEAITRSAHGFVIVGQPESGKTTLLNALLPLLPANSLMSVERAGELRLPQEAARLIPIWPGGSENPISFGGQIRAALDDPPQTLLLDEVRSDEPETIAPLLADEAGFRQIWSFRGAIDPMRVRSALGMLARRANPAQPEAAVQQLYQRLPFVMTVGRRGGRLQLRGIAEWQDRGAEYAEYIPLWQAERDTFQRTGERPARALELPADFWETLG